MAIIVAIYFLPAGNADPVMECAALVLSLSKEPLVEGSLQNIPLAAWGSLEQEEKSGCCLEVALVVAPLNTILSVGLFHKIEIGECNDNQQVRVQIFWCIMTLCSNNYVLCYIC